jgi:4-hydroxy-2-oxoheptanedioate aldolase
MSRADRRSEDFRRHLTDLEVDEYEGATDRAAREAVFRQAVELIKPVVADVLQDFNRLYLADRGTVAFEEPNLDGLESVWSLSWPAQRAARRRGGVGGPPDLGPIQVRAIFPPGWTHGHLAGEHVGHWPMQVTTSADAARQRDAIWTIAEAELHEWIFSVERPWDAFEPVDGVDAAAGSVPGGELKTHLRRREVVQGIFCRSAATVEIVQAAQLAGLNFLIVDVEHGVGPTDAELSAFCEVGRLRGVAILVRIAAPVARLAARALDLGAAGIVVPQCRSADEVRSVLDGCFLPPAGRRGFSPRTRAAAFAAQDLGSRRLSDVVSAINRSTVVIVQVETPELLESMSEVASEPRIDGFLLGAHDLAVAAGTPDQDMGPEAASQIAAALRQRPTSWGRMVSPGQKEATVQAGGTLLVLGTDAALLADAMRAVVADGGAE